MTASESLKLYQLLFQITNNDNQAKSLVAEFERTIENTVEKRFEKEEKKFVPKDEFERVGYKIDGLSNDINLKFDLIRQEMKTTNADLKAEIRGDLNKHLIWIFASLVGIATFSLAIAKFLFN